MDDKSTKSRPAQTPAKVSGKAPIGAINCAICGERVEVFHKGTRTCQRPACKKKDYRQRQSGKGAKTVKLIALGRPKNGAGKVSESDT